MTLIISICAPDLVLLVGDRRLSSNGNLVDDDTAKIGTFSCDDGMMLWAYTGLAKHNRFEARRWISDLLISSGPPDYRLREVIARFCDRATDFFDTNLNVKYLPPEAKRLTVIFTGYTAGGTPVAAVVSNCEDGLGKVQPVAQSQFAEHVVRFSANDRRGGSMIHAVGGFQALRREGVDQLYGLLLEGAPMIALRQKASQLIREAADSAIARNAIGKTLMSAWMERPVHNIPPVPYSAYAPEREYGSVALIEQVSLSPLGSFAISDVRLTVEGLTHHPRQPRNARCSCGSGMKYKHCHGRKSHSS